MHRQNLFAALSQSGEVSQVGGNDAPSKQHVDDNDQQARMEQQQHQRRKPGEASFFIAGNVKRTNVKNTWGGGGYVFIYAQRACAEGLDRIEDRCIVSMPGLHLNRSPGFRLDHVSFSGQ